MRSIGLFLQPPQPPRSGRSWRCLLAQCRQSAGGCFRPTADVRAAPDGAQLRHTARRLLGSHPAVVLPHLGRGGFPGVQHIELKQAAPDVLRVIVNPSRVEQMVNAASGDDTTQALHV